MFDPIFHQRAQILPRESICFIVLSNWLDWSTSLQVLVFEMKIGCDPCFNDMGVVMYLP